jgi:hypothetical protein
MSLSPFHSQSLLNASLDPHWNMELPGADLMGFHNHLLGSRHGFPNVPAPELGLDLTEESDKWVMPTCQASRMKMSNYLSTTAC